ncbi:MAG TPA: ABC transporter substrate-binding protein [Acetobacteraceae bacterium]|jgi:peptide/nickel transport system substrate-binding protein
MKLSRRALLAAGATLPVLRRSARAAAKDTLRFGLSTYPPSLALWSNVGTSAVTVKLQTHRGLLSFAPDGTVRGELAEHWERDGDTGWAFHLRDARFHTGAPVTAADVKWTIEQIAAPTSTAYYRSLFQQVDRIDTPDARTVRIVMKAPLVTLPLVLASPHMPIVPNGATEHDGVPPGAGPFVLTSQERGVGLEFKAFDKFYGAGLPKLKSLHMIVYADETLRVSALQSGDVDIIEYVPWQSMNALGADPKIKMDATDGPFMYLIFNGKSGPFANPKLREAVAYAADREAIVKAAFYGRGRPLGGPPLVKGTEFYDEAAVNHWTYDPARAKALMTEAGMPNGFNCTLLSNSQYGMHKSTAEVVQQNLAAIGIQAELKLPDWATYTTLANRGQYQFAVAGGACDNNDPDGLGSLIDGTLSPSASRSYGMDVPGLHELLIAGEKEFDPAKRKQIYARVMDLVLDQAPIVTLCWRSQAYAMTKDVQGFHNIPGQLTFFSGITLEDTAFA